MKNIFIIVGPSGAGKNTIIDLLVKGDSNFVVPSSYTTRSKRKVETKNKIIHYVDKEKFFNLVKIGEIFEWAYTHGHYYGTSKKSVEDALSKNKTLLCEIDVRGADSFRKIFKDKVVIIFIDIGDIDEIKKRILLDKDHKNITPHELKKRLISAKRELLYKPKADFIVNNVFNHQKDTIIEIKKIMRID